MTPELKEIIRSMREDPQEEDLEIAHVTYRMIEKTPYSFHFYAVYERNQTDILTEFFYDLRNKEYFLKRSGKQLTFSNANIDTVVPREREYHNKGFTAKEAIESFFEYVSVEENKGMYQAMLYAIGALGEERVLMTSRALIRLMNEYNKLELLYKAGVPIKSMSNYTFREKVRQASANDVRKVHQIFGITKSQFKFINETMSSYDKFMDVVDYVPMVTQQDMDTYRGYMKYIEDLELKYNVDNRLQVFQNNNSVSTFVTEAHYYRSNARSGNSNIFSFMYEHNHPNPLKLIEYLLFECFLSQGINWNIAFGEYADYYRMCKDMQYERFDRYPRYLRTAHDVVTMNYKVSVDEVTNRKFSEATAVYKDYEVVVGDYAVVVPDKVADLIYEGNMLQHCVGSYVKNIIKSSTQIMFLRSKKERKDPLITMEVRNDRVTQVRGQGNRLPDPEEAAAVSKFAKKFELQYA